MRVPVVTTCCCGCSLETGSKIIGFTQVICGIIQLISHIVSLTSDSADASIQFGGIVGSFISCLLGLILLSGIRTKNSERVHKYLLISGIIWILAILLMLFQSFSIMIEMGTSFGMFMLGVSIILGLTQAYFLTVVYNYKFQLIQEGHQDEPI